MDNIVTLSPTDRDYLVSLFTAAAAADKDIHICTGSDSRHSWVKVKVGQGMWTPPLYGKVY